MAPEMIEQNYMAAVRDGIKEEMRRDKTVVMWGQSARLGGDMSTTGGIVEEFGENRILNTPINEVAMIDMALGAAVTGLRPIVNIMTASFAALAGDALMLKCGATWKGSFYKKPVPLVVYMSFRVSEWAWTMRGQPSQ